jgi:hypothetical protein
MIGIVQQIVWQNTVLLQALTGRKEWKFFAALKQADPALAATWWAALLLRGMLPAMFANRDGRARRRGAMRQSSRRSELYGIRAAAYR